MKFCGVDLRLWFWFMVKQIQLFDTHFNEFMFHRIMCYLMHRAEFEGILKINTKS